MYRMSSKSQTCVHFCYGVVFVIILMVFLSPLICASDTLIRIINFACFTQMAVSMCLLLWITSLILFLISYLSTMWFFNIFFIFSCTLWVRFHNKYIYNHMSLLPHLSPRFTVILNPVFFLHLSLTLSLSYPNLWYLFSILHMFSACTVTCYFGHNMYIITYEFFYILSMTCTTWGKSVGNIM